MRIGVDTLQVEAGRATSNRIYLKSLLGAIAEIDDRNEYLIFVSRSSLGTFNFGRPNFREVVCPLVHLNTGLRILWEQIRLPRFLRRHGVDLLFSPNNSGPVRPGCKSVLTIQMVGAYMTPHCYSPLRRWYFHWVTRSLAMRSDKVVCVSDYLRRTMCMYMDIPGEKMEVVPEAPPAHFRPVPREEAARLVRESLGLPMPYLLNVANVIPYKNTLGLVKAFAHVRAAGYPHTLVIVGGERWPKEYARRVDQTIRQLELGPWIRFVGHLNHEDLPAVYSAADLLCFPSTCETWGLPVVEALACGCPVVTSDWSSLPEVVAGAAELVDPFVPKEIARGIYRVLDSPSRRQDLVDRGLRRASELSWRNSAREMIRIFEECGARTPEHIAG